MIPDNALQLEESLEGLFVDAQLLVAQPQVVQSLEKEFEVSVSQWDMTGTYTNVHNIYIKINTSTQQ